MISYRVAFIADITVTRSGGKLYIAFVTATFNCLWKSENNAISVQKSGRQIEASRHMIRGSNTALYDVDFWL